MKTAASRIQAKSRRTPPQQGAGAVRFPCDRSGWCSSSVFRNPRQCPGSGGWSCIPWCRRGRCRRESRRVRRRPIVRVLACQVPKAVLVVPSHRISLHELYRPYTDHPLLLTWFQFAWMFGNVTAISMAVRNGSSIRFGRCLVAGDYEGQSVFERRFLLCDVESGRAGVAPPIHTRPRPCPLSWRGRRSGPRGHRHCTRRAVSITPARRSGPWFRSSPGPEVKVCGRRGMRMVSTRTRDRPAPP